MKYLILILVIIITGCSGMGHIIEPPIESEEDEMSCDVWPCLWGKNNAGASDFVYANFWDVGAAAFQNTQVIADALKAQWTPQRSGFGYRTNGKWGFAIIEAASNDLEYWENADVKFTADGIWALTDDDASQDWLAVDVEARQNYVWANVAEAGIFPRPFYINLNAGVPNWAMLAHTFVGPIDNIHYSIALDNSLQGYAGMAGVISGAVNYTYIQPTAPVAVITFTVVADGEYPQILGNFANSIFYTYNNSLYFLGNVLHWKTGLSELPYTATALTSDYMVAHNPVDDTIHVVLVDHDPAGNSLLVYLRRTSDGWSTPTTLKTVDTSGVGITLSWPQITLDWFNNICIKFIYNDGVGDLRQFLLTTDDYSEFDTPGNWTESSNVDDSEDDVLWVVAPTNMPEWIPTSGVADEFILLEGGDFILLEGGDRIIL